MAFSRDGIRHRPTVMGRRGMVSSANPISSLAGLRILMQGGNAVDAAVATAAALNVAEPYMSGIGGVGYMHIYSARDREHKIVDYVGLTPATTNISDFDQENKNEGPMSALVPGACGGWFEALRRFGTMDPETVFAPAIEHAEQGIALTVSNNFFFEACASGLLKYPASSSTYLLDRRAPEPGEVIVQSDLAETFRTVARSGPEAFYTGEIGEIIAAYIAEAGGLITKEDLAAFKPEWIDPVCTSYRGYNIWAPPPPCQAIQYLETLNIMEGYDVASMGHNTSDTLHTFLEAVKLSIADRAEFAAIENPPTTGLLSKEFAAARRKLIRDRAQLCGGDLYTANKMEDEVLAGDPYAHLLNECTTHFDTIDADGNAVACTQSLGSGFGSNMVIPGTGVCLNNFMNWFDLEPKSPNAIGPAKKNEMCLSPIQIWDDYGLRLLIGTPGSHGILQTTPQMIMNVLDHNMNLQSAIEAPRVKTVREFTIGAEDRIGDQVFAELELRGHKIERLGDWTASVGGGQGIMVDRETGSFTGGADPRRDGYAIGW